MQKCLKISLWTRATQDHTLSADGLMRTALAAAGDEELSSSQKRTSREHLPGTCRGAGQPSWAGGKEWGRSWPPPFVLWAASQELAHWRPAQGGTEPNTRLISALAPPEHSPGWAVTAVRKEGRCVGGRIWFEVSQIAISVKIMSNSLCTRCNKLLVFLFVHPQDKSQLLSWHLTKSSYLLLQGLGFIFSTNLLQISTKINS